MVHEAPLGRCITLPCKLDTTDANQTFFKIAVLENTPPATAPTGITEKFIPMATIRSGAPRTEVCVSFELLRSTELRLEIEIYAPLPSQSTPKTLLFSTLFVLNLAGQFSRLHHSSNCSQETIRYPEGAKYQFNTSCNCLMQLTFEVTPEPLHANAMTHFTDLRR